MFGLDFSALPTPIQIGVAVGVGFAAFVAVLLGLRSRIKLKDVKELEGDPTAELAAQLAEMRLRDEFKDVVRIAREAVEQRIDAQVNSVRAELGNVARHDSEARSEIRDAIETIRADVHKVEVALARIPQARAR